MAWFLNFYRCGRCRKIWTDEWSCTCDDECPHCGFRNMTPFNSEDLTELIVEEAIVGMLPHSKLGRAMASKLKVYADDKHPHEAQKPEAKEFPQLA